MARELIFLHGSSIARCTAIVDKPFDYYTLQYMASGAVDLYQGERHYRLSGSWFWSAYPGPRIRFTVAPGCPFWEHRYIAFQGPLVTRWQSEGLWLQIPQRSHHSADYARIFDELLGHALSGDSWRELKAVNLLERILIDLGEARSQPASYEPWLDRVLERLESMNGFAPDYSNLASDCGLGLNTLRRRFKQSTGITLHTYVMQSRMAAARQLLGETDLPITAVAERLGYRDVYFFSKQFRQQLGVSPSAYRRTRQM